MRSAKAAGRDDAAMCGKGFCTILRAAECTPVVVRANIGGQGLMTRSDLESTARAMVAKGKGILAADESSGTIKKRFDSIQLNSTEEARRTYREMLFIK